MAAPSSIIVDQYSTLSHKELVGVAGGDSIAANYTPSWISPADRRRLSAYLVRYCYIANTARLTLPSTVTDLARRTYREYGDPAVLVDRVVAAVLGDEWQIVVDGADDDLLDGPSLPERPEPAPDDADELVKRIAAGRIAAWEAEATAAVDEWLAALDAQPRARAMQTALRHWADRSLLASHVNEAEHDAVGLGDCLYTLWPREGDWPTIAVYDPDSYFPVLDDDPTNEFPSTVHAAWEFEERVDGVTKRYVRRLTWRLVPVTSAHVVTGDDGAPAWDGGAGPLLSDAETLVDGDIVRVMPWHGDDDEPAKVTCWFSDGIWDLARVHAAKSNALDPDQATWIEPGRDLGFDFLPVVHVPNTAAGKAHFGRSIIDNVAQAFDDVAQNDGDVMSAASYIGDPTIAMSGAKAPSDGSVIAPGMVYGLGENGRMDVLDLSAGVDRLMDAGDRLQDRAWQNAGVPREVVGRATSDAASGIHLALKLAPYAQLIGSLRLPREPKYRVLLRLAAKMAMVAGALDPGPIPSARLAFGNFLPTSKAETVDMVAAALKAHAISTQTAVAMLVSAGWPIADAHAEIARIRSENTAAAKDLADATGSEAAAAEWLGIEVPAATAAPTITLPPVVP